MVCLPDRAAGQDHRFFIVLPLVNAFDQRGEQAPFFALQLDLLGQQAMVTGLQGQRQRRMFGIRQLR